MTSLRFKLATDAANAVLVEVGIVAVILEVL
jgi:hypothetical protein